MKKTFKHKWGKRSVLSMISIIFLTSFINVDPIILTDEPISLVPKEFYISGVIDARADKSKIAQLLIRDNAKKLVLQNVDLPGGTAVAINRYLQRNLRQDQSLRPVVISIKDFKLTETAVANGGIDGQIKLVMSFELKKNYGLEHLLEYRGGIHYLRYRDNPALAESQLRSILTNGLIYFNNWIKINVNTNKKLAKAVNIRFSDFKEKPEGDTIYYAANRPLTWADFQSKLKPGGKYMAEVMPGLGYDLNADMKNGTINVDLAVKTYLAKSTCRAYFEGRSDYTLNHEQRHFDVVKIIAEQFKRKIKANRLTPDNFEAIINMQYLDSYRDMDAMQKAYDGETGHGMNKAAQDKWNNKIDAGLKD